MNVEEAAVRKYALLQAAKDSEYVKNVHGSYLNVFATALGGDSDKWDTFHIVDREFPATNDLDKYEGFVISGSPHDAYSNEHWILELSVLLQTLAAMQKKVLGVCSGHQMLCRAFGGKVAKSDSSMGMRRSLPLSRYIIEYHQDEVWEVPIRGQVLAWSDKTRLKCLY